ncbi:nitroreductase family deazaflavin-dependent oxidoreductase [Kribbella antibiotica]|uniref:Nitroreductase family deazaflavin-dependent oxidoreductase n=1 Tax=Kribbella antibiotica TaxID=190195 RepID=A0A4R4Z180_9ACTN|nr:nitroreductase family deazaflavin-dependent oxidoreductase [Kribbella antibiotica]TDD51506.1 nitroreductase family deazaflavin-dependent oxidoreductase [Kribbella antibiotica]
MNNTSTQERQPGTPGALSRWFQRTVNGRTTRKIRRGRATMMGMDLLVLTTVGRRSGLTRENPLAWFADGPDAWVLIASGGGSQNPGWYANLLANPAAATIELPDRGVVPVTPEPLTGASYEAVWASIIQAQPRFAKYQQKSARKYPLVRLTPRA